MASRLSYAYIGPNETGPQGSASSLRIRRGTNSGFLVNPIADTIGSGVVGTGSQNYT